MTTLVAAERELPYRCAAGWPPKGSGMNRKPRFAIAVTVAFFVLLYLPIFAVVLFSFNTKKSLTVFEALVAALVPGVLQRRRTDQVASDQLGGGRSPPWSAR